MLGSIRRSFFCLALVFSFLLTSCVPVSPSASPVSMASPSLTSITSKTRLPSPSPTCSPTPSPTPALSISYAPTPVVRDNVKFSDLPLAKPTADDLTALIQKFISDMNAATSAEEQIAFITDFDATVRKTVSDPASAASIRFDQNPTDDAKADYAYFINTVGGISDIIDEADAAIVNSKFIDQLEQYFGKAAIDIYRENVDEYDPKLADLNEQINDLTAQYTQNCVSTAGTRAAFLKDANDTFDQLLALRENAANLMGYDSFVDAVYDGGGFDADDVRAYIENVKQTVLPVYQKLADSTARGGANRCPPSKYLKPIAANISDERDLELQVLRATLDEMNPLIDYMTANEFLDILPRDGKAQTDFTQFLSGIQVPFIFLGVTDANYPSPIFHEFGHALEFFDYPQIDLTERFDESPEAAEVSSVCMEVLTTSQYEMMYGNEADNARLTKVYDLATDFVWATLVSEFELDLYDKPDMTQADRDSLFQDLMKEYRIATSSDFSWEDVHHFFDFPLYYISYSLDDGVAFQLWQMMNTDLDGAKATYLSYLHDCTQTDYLTRLSDAGFANPFDTQSLQDLAKFLSDTFTSKAYLTPTNRS